MLVLLLTVLQGALSQACVCSDAKTAYASNAIVFFGKIGAGKTATVQTQIKGLSAGASVKLTTSCAIDVNKVYLIAGAAGASATAPITVQCVMETVPLPQRFFLMQQTLSVTGTTAKCVDGSTPLNCDQTTACTPKGCVGSTKCEVNRCGGCAPVYSTAAGARTCLNACPDGSTPVKCVTNPCTGAKPPAACPNAKCVPNFCNGCSVTWVDVNGKAVCSGQSVFKQCANVQAVQFGTGTTSLGFAVKNGVCSEIKGASNQGLPLFPTLAACTKACACRDTANVQPGTGSVSWFTFSGGVCKQVTGGPLVKAALAPSSFASLAACRAACVAGAATTAPATTARPVTTPATTAPVTPAGTAAPATRTACTKGSAGCCPDGLTQEVCVDQNVGVYCQYLNCGSQVPKRCVADPCNACKPTIYTDNNVVIANDKCSLQLPDYTRCNPLATVTCPAGIPVNCGPKPTACPSNWNARCIIDPCSCKPVWMNEDLRQPTSACLAALVAKCVVNAECPTNFQCVQAPNQADIIKSLPSGFQLQCIQETCTCSPTWIQAPVGGAFIPGVKTKCQTGASNCCPDGSQQQNCASLADNTARTCAQMKCTNQGQAIAIGSCSPDPCNDCNVKITDKSGRTVDVGSCNFGNDIGTTCPFNPSIKCPANVKPSCPPLDRTVCPADWKLECVVDPCLCRSFWLDNDVRYTPGECSQSIQPPCIPADQCPQLSCTAIPDEMKQALGPDVIKTLVCVQEQCTCRPIWVPGAQAAAMGMGMSTGGRP